MKMIEIHRSRIMVILEIEKSEFKDNSFDDIWDEVRRHYNENLYSLKKIDVSKDKVYVKLNIKKRKAYKGKNKLKRW
jgi:hypothetical protein